VSSRKPDASWHAVPKPAREKPAPASVPELPQQTREKPAPVSVPKPPRVARSWKFKAPWSVRPKPVREKPAPVPVSKPLLAARSRKSGVLLSILLVLLIVISFGIVLWSYAVGYHTPTTAPLHKATIPSSSRSTVAPTTRPTETST